MKRSFKMLKILLDEIFEASSSFLLSELERIFFFNEVLIVLLNLFRLELFLFNWCLDGENGTKN
jgi:hypothetical protein